MKEQSGATFKLQEQVNAIIKKKQSTKKICALQQIQTEAVAMAEAQQWKIEMAAASATTFMAEILESEGDVYHEAKPKDTFRVPLATLEQDVLQKLQGVSSATTTQQCKMLDQKKKPSAALLWEKVLILSWAQ